MLGFSQKCLDFGKREGDLENEVPMVTKAGDLLAHHSLTLHSACSNTSGLMAVVVFWPQRSKQASKEGRREGRKQAQRERERERERD